MLPFLKPRQIADAIVLKRTKPEAEQAEHSPEELQCAESLMDAVHAKDVKAIAAALKAHRTLNSSNDPQE